MGFIAKLKELIFPSKLKCDICAREMDETKNKTLCENCFKKLPFIFHGCIKCGEKIEGDYDVCYACKNNLREFDRAYSVFEYDGLAKEMVLDLKYNNKKFLAKTMAGFLTDHIIKNDIKFDTITYVPISRKNLKSRGYNQAKMLAKEICKNLGIELESEILMRIKENTSQVELTAKERAQNIENSFIVRNKNAVKGKVVLVVDDVLTTGATLNEVAKMLKKSGAKRVLGLTFANTTRKIKFEGDNSQIPTKTEN